MTPQITAQQSEFKACLLLLTLWLHSFSSGLPCYRLCHRSIIDRMPYTTVHTPRRTTNVNKVEHRIRAARSHARAWGDLPPSPAPAHMRRRTPVYRPVLRVLEVLILCLALVILALLACWVYHLAFEAFSSGFGMWKRHMLRKTSGTI